jgi:hypothetical protein
LKRPKIAPQFLTRNDISAFGRRLIDDALRVDKQLHTLRRLSVAGLSLSLECYDPTIMAGYAARFDTEQSDGVPGEADLRIIVLHAEDIGWDSVPLWDDKRFPPPQFQQVVRAVGLRLSYPFSDGIWRVFDPVARVGVQITNSRADLPAWDFGAPLAQFLYWLLPGQGLRLTHAATVGRGNDGILLVGDGGAGKSETTLASIAAGLVTCGDDYVATGVDGGPVALRLFRILKQDPMGLVRFSGIPEVVGRSPVNWQGKVEFDPDLAFPGCLTNRLEIRAAIAPSIREHRMPKLVSISTGELMRSLMPSNLYQYPGEPDDGLRFFSRFLCRMPCYRLELSLDPRLNSETLGRLLERTLQ